MGRSEAGLNLHLQLNDVENPDRLRADCTGRAEELHAEFPETARVEVTVRRVGPEHETHVHVTGKDLHLASRARNSEPVASVNNAFEKVRRQLRKHHDKQIFGRRRDAHRGPSRPH